MRRIRFTIFSLWLILLACLSLRSYPLPVQGGLDFLRSLAGLGLLLGALLATGRGLLLRFRVFTASLSQEALFSFALGAGLMSVLVFLLGHFSVLSQGSAWALVAIFWIAGFKHLEHFFTELRHSLRSKHPWEGSSTEMLSLLAAGLSAGVIFVLCLAPVSFYDALVYHLALPQRAAALGYSAPIEGNLYSWLPAAAERLWTLCILLDGGGQNYRIASLLNFTFCLATALAVTDAGARFLPRQQLWLPAALFLTQPLLVLSFGVFGCDGIAAFYTFLSLVAFLNTLGERNQSFRANWLCLSALLAGFAVAVKPVALIHAATLLILFAMKAMSDEDERRPGLLATMAGLFILPLLPWLIRNFTITGNPFMPFGLSLFGSEIFKPASSVYMEHLHSYGDAVHFWALPWDLTFDLKGAAFGGGGHVTFLFLGILPVAFVLALVRELRWLAAYLLISFILWAMGPRVLRYAIPALPGLTILCAACLAEAELWARSKGLSLALRIFVVGALFLGAAHVMAITTMGFDPFRVSVGIENPEDYLLARGVNTVKAAAWLKEKAPRAKLLILGDSRSAGLPPESFACTVFEANPFKGWLDQAKSPQDLDAILTQKGYDFALFNIAEMDRVGNSEGPHYDYFSSPASEALFDRWLKSHAGKGYSGEGVEIFPLP
jgi:hypothetical protein